MESSIVLLGIAKILFGIFVGAAGIYVSARGLHRLIGSGATSAQQREGNIAFGILQAGSLIALGLLMQHAVMATFSAIDLMQRPSGMSWLAARHVLTYASLHVVVSAIVSAIVLALGTWLFSRLTRDLDEMEEIGKGNIAPALVLAAVMVVLALMTAPGLQTTLDGLLPLPALGQGEIMAPS